MTDIDALPLTRDCAGGRFLSLRYAGQWLRRNVFFNVFPKCRNPSGTVARGGVYVEIIEADRSDEVFECSLGG